MIGESGRKVRRHHLRRRGPRAAFGLVAVLAVGVTSAHAEPQEHFSGNNQGSFVVKRFCGDMKVRIDYDYDFTLVARESGPDGLPRYTVSTHGVETFTRLATGKVVTSRTDSVMQDVRVTDNGDGTLSVVYQTPGAARYTGPDGEVLLIDSRPSWFEIVLDHGGTPSDPSDDSFISEELIREVAAHVNEDFCDAYRTATS